MSASFKYIISQQLKHAEVSIGNLCHALSGKSTCGF